MQYQEIRELQVHGIKFDDIKNMNSYHDFFNQPEGNEPDNEPLNPDALEDLEKLQFEKNFKVDK